MTLDNFFTVKKKTTKKKRKSSKKTAKKSMLKKTSISKQQQKKTHNVTKKDKKTETKIKKIKIRKKKYIKQPDLSRDENRVLKFLSSPNEIFPATIFTLSNWLDLHETDVLRIMDNLMKKKNDVSYYEKWNGYEHAWELKDKMVYRKIVTVEIIDEGKKEEETEIAD